MKTGVSPQAFSHSFPTSCLPLVSTPKFSSSLKLLLTIHLVAYWSRVLIPVPLSFNTDTELLPNNQTAVVPPFLFIPVLRLTFPPPTPLPRGPEYLSLHLWHKRSWHHLLNSQLPIAFSGCFRCCSWNSHLSHNLLNPNSLACRWVLDCITAEKRGAHPHL